MDESAEQASKAIVAHVLAVVAPTCSTCTKGYAQSVTACDEEAWTLDSGLGPAKSQTVSKRQAGPTRGVHKPQALSGGLSRTSNPYGTHMEPDWLDPKRTRGLALGCLGRGGLGRGWLPPALFAQGHFGVAAVQRRGGGSSCAIQPNPRKKKLAALQGQKPQTQKPTKTEHIRRDVIPSQRLFHSAPPSLHLMFSPFRARHQSASLRKVFRASQLVKPLSVGVWLGAACVKNSGRMLPLVSTSFALTTAPLVRAELTGKVELGDKLARVHICRCTAMPTRRWPGSFGRASTRIGCHVTLLLRCAMECLRLDEVSVRMHE